MRRWRDHGLSIFFGVIFLLSLAGQSVAGLLAHNAEQTAHGSPEVSWWGFVTSSQFVVDVAENWQSEYLQFFLFVGTTVWLVQRGSPESKKPDDQGLDTDENQLVGPYARPDSPAWAKVDGWRRSLFSNSLLLVMGAVFVLSWLLQSLAGLTVYNADQAEHGQAAISWAAYLGNPDFWNRTLQNWQSEFLAVGSMVALSIYLRQRGSAESKPVGAPHDESAVSSE